MDRSQQAQLQGIREITVELASRRLVHWLFGGWAVDFAANRITRAHDDVDFVVRENDVDAVAAALEALGYRGRPSKHPDHQRNWEKSGLRVQINLVRHTRAGAAVSPGTFEDWPWTDGAFGDNRGRIEGIEVPIVSPTAQLDAKRQFPSHPAGSSHREKDLHDIAILESLVSSQDME